MRLIKSTSGQYEAFLVNGIKAHKDTIYQQIAGCEG